MFRFRFRVQGLHTHTHCHTCLPCLKLGPKLKKRAPTFAKKRESPSFLSSIGAPRPSSFIRWLLQLLDMEFETCRVFFNIIRFSEVFGIMSSCLFDALFGMIRDQHLELEPKHESRLMCVLICSIYTIAPLLGHLTTINLQIACNVHFILFLAQLIMD